MTFFTVFLILVAAVGLYLFLRSQSSQSKASEREAVGRPKSIESVAEGDVLSLRGVGSNLDDVDVVIKAVHVYEEDGYTWRELECEAGAQTKWIDVERDDELTITYCETKLSLADVGLTPAQLDRITQSDEGECSYQNATFTYEESGSARFFRNGDRSGPGERFDYWDFESESGSQFISVEKWGKGEYVVYFSEQLRPSQYTIF